MSQPGQPNWLGLLQWSLAYSDGTSASTGKTLSEEDKLWLERVMKEAVTDEPARLNEIMIKLLALLDKTPTVDDEDMIENSLEEIKGIVDQIDMAQVFTKFGGSKCLLRVINCEHINSELKALAASVIGTMAQNNIIVQDILLKEEIVDNLLKTYIVTDSALLSTKILFAVSCIIRGHVALETHFVNSLAELTLPRALDSNHQPLILRAVFLSSALISSDSTSTQRISKLSALVLPSVIEQFNSSSVDLSENVAALLTTLLHTQHGWTLLTQTYAGAVESALAQREQWVRARSSTGAEEALSVFPEEDQLSCEEEACCLKVVANLRQLLNSAADIRFPHSTVTTNIVSFKPTNEDSFDNMKIC